MREIQSLSLGVNTVLSRYIEIHNALFKFSIRRILPIPGIFKPIDFASHHENLQEFHEELGQILTAIVVLRGSSPEPPSAGIFLQALEEYASALCEAVGMLCGICARLRDKAKGAADFSWPTYNEDMDAYQIAVQHYVQLGGNLNTLYKQL